MPSHKLEKTPTRNKIPNNIEQNPACIPILSNSKKTKENYPTAIPTKENRDQLTPSLVLLALICSNNPTVLPPERNIPTRGSQQIP
jgi:hypothetical protein